MTMNQNKLTPEQKCAAQHFGPWMVEPKWFGQAVDAVKDGTWQADVISERDDDGEEHVMFAVTDEGVAVIPMDGHLTKGRSSYGGTSTLRVRRALRMAVADDAVLGIMIHGDSPGGTAAGMTDLAEEIRATRRAKPVACHISDMGASAMYYAASQTGRITANAGALIGSIGTIAMLVDSSGMAEKQGVKIHVLATGAHKGTGVPGAPISDDQIVAEMEVVNDINEQFLQAVMSGRGISRDDLMKVADGRVFIAEKAMQHGLIDEVSTFDAALKSFNKEIIMETAEQFQAYAAKHPEAALNLPAVQDTVAAARIDGVGEGRKSEQDRFVELQAMNGATADFVAEQFAAGHDANQASVALAKSHADENATLRQQVADLQARQGQSEDGQPPLQLAQGETGDVDPDDHKAVAKSEWKADASLRKSFSSEQSYLNVRKAELSGRLRVHA